MGFQEKVGEGCAGHQILARFSARIRIDIGEWVNFSHSQRDKSLEVLFIKSPAASRCGPEPVKAGPLRCRSYLNYISRLLSQRSRVCLI